MITADAISRIVGFRADGVPVVSMYARVEPGGSRRDLHTRGSSLLDQIRPLAKDRQVAHEARLSVRSDIDRIRAALGEGQWQPGAMAIFSCSGRGLYEEVPLPRRTRDRIITDATPFARPMLAVLEQYRRGCVAVIDKASARLWEVYQDEMRELTKIKDRVLRKPNYAAGLNEDHVRSKAGELSKRHFRHVAGQLDELFRSGRYDVLIIGGHEYEVPAFVQLLPRELRDRVAGTFGIDPT